MLDVVDVLRVLQELVHHTPGPLDQVQRQDGHAVRLEGRGTRAKINTKILIQINRTKKLLCEQDVARAAQIRDPPLCLRATGSAASGKAQQHGQLLLSIVFGALFPGKNK